MIDLWPGVAPGMPPVPPVERMMGEGVDRRVQGVSRPNLAVFEAVRPNGAAMLVIPGGGYEWVWFDKEGVQIARWLARQGITAFVLTYRLPGEGWAAGPDVALSDAQRAMRLIRHRAKGYGIDPKRVGAMGFSAGGHLCADLATRFAARTYDPVDAADALSARPMIAAPIYPVISMDKAITHAGSRARLIGADADAALETAHSPDRNVSADTPPVFLTHAEDDGTVKVENALRFHDAVRAKGVAAEIHLFGEGGHGFALSGIAGKPVAAWPDLFLRWARAKGLHSG